jgi:hypothetical protein
VSKKHRLSFSISQELFKRLNHIPWGVRANLLRIVLERIVRAGEKHGKQMYGALLDGKWEIVPRSEK